MVKSVAEELAVSEVGPHPHAGTRQRAWLAWLDAAIPVAVIFLVLMAVWYALAAWFNLNFLNVHELDVDPTGWKRMSASEKLYKGLSTGQPILPTPIQTIADFFDRLHQGVNADGNGLVADLYWTGRASIFGFLLGTAVGVTLAVIFMTNRILAQSLLPFVVASQTIPIVALVPAIMVALGLGLRSEVLISAYLAFFSITVSTYKGLQSVQPIAFELMRSYAARPWQVFLKLRLPAALPFLFTGLKIGVTASLVGAIIAELPSGSPHGLGQAFLNASQYSLNIQLWSTMMSAAVLGLTLYGIVVVTEKLVVRWRTEPVS